MESDLMDCDEEIFISNEEEISTSDTLDMKGDEISQVSVFSDELVQSESISKSVSDEEFRKQAECAEAIVQLEKSAQSSELIKQDKTPQDRYSQLTQLINDSLVSKSDIKNSTQLVNDALVSKSDNTDSPESLLKVSHLNLPEYDKCICHYCGKKLANTYNMCRHYRVVHKVELRKENEDVKCLECDAGFMNIRELRTHLQLKHNYNMGVEEVTFPNMEAFLKWKYEVERETLTSYVASLKTKKTPTGMIRYYHYRCHRSGKFIPKVNGPRKRMLRTSGTCKIGIKCTSTITATETPTEVRMKYYPNHYGHGKETSLITLTAEEERAITESTSKGVSFENVITEMQESQSTTDQFQLCVLRKKDSLIITKAFESEEFNLNLSVMESIDRWVASCCKMENSPILAYQRNETMEDKKTLSFFLVIMTEFQKHVLLTASKKVVCVNVLFCQRDPRCYLTSLLAMDDTDFPVPVAFCLSNKVDKQVVTMFFNSIYEEAGTIDVEYFLSDSETLYPEAWKEVMNDNSKWLWNMWHVENRLRFQLKVYKGNAVKKAQIFKTIKNLIECKNQVVFSCMYNDLIQNLANDIQGKTVANFIEQKYGPNQTMWAYCFRKEIPFATNIKLDTMHSTLKYCCQVGKRRRLDKFLFVLMKFLREKMLHRLSLTAEQDIDLALDNIKVCHKLGLEIPPEYVTVVALRMWLVLTGNEDEYFYVALENEMCPELCNLKCSECEICVHTYACTCSGNQINGNLCEHIHAVVWNFVTPHFSPPASDGEDCGAEEVEEKEKIVENWTQYKKLHRQTLKVAHNVYRKIENDNWTMSYQSLQSVMKKLNECIDICLGKPVEDSTEIQRPVVNLIPVVDSNGTRAYVLSDQIINLAADNTMQLTESQILKSSR